MSGPHILVVNDEPTIRRTLHANLAARGYDVTAVETGDGALAVDRAGRFRLPAPPPPRPCFPELGYRAGKCTE